MRRRQGFLFALLVLAAVCCGVAVSGFRADTTQAQSLNASAPSGAPSIFTPAHRSVLEAVKDFFGIRPKPVQPIAFPHNVHLAKKIQCVACHRGVAKGPEAGLPSVKTCMVCHGLIATDRPGVQRVAAYAERGEDISWQRVYGFSRTAHVKFNHAPHVRAGVNCAACHGDLAQQSVAERKVNHTMGFCLDCHREKKVSVDCMTCHY